MKPWIGILILAALLCGCARQDATPSTNPSAPSQPAATSPVSDPVPDVQSAWYIELNDTYEAAAAMGENILLFGNDKLTLISSDGECELASVPLTLPLPDSDLVHISEEGIVYFDEERYAVIWLDSLLEQTDRAQLEQIISGDPCLAPDGSGLYFCTGEGIRYWDFETNITRNLKLHSGNWQGICGMPDDGQLLVCQLQLDDGSTQTLLISAQTGETLAEGPELAHLTISGDFFCCPLDVEWIFGYTDQQPQNLLLQQAIALPQLHAAVTAAVTESGVLLDYYDLDTGLRTASERIDGAAEVKNLSLNQGNLTFLSGNRLYTWCFDISPQLHPVEDTALYTAYRYTYDDPDTEGLAALQTQAEALGDQYGVDIVLWQDVTAITPEGFIFEPEYRTQAYEQALAQLEQILSGLPTGFVKRAASWTQDLTLHILLTRSITAPADKTCTATSAAQYLLGTNAYIALEMGHDLQQPFYHALAHVMDTLMLSQSKVLYHWNELNPSGFQYDNSYIANKNLDDSKYLQGSNRYFISSYAMRYPVEDRATIWEHAMMPDNQDLFSSKYMQSKLKRICKALRDAFDLEEESYLWEQYLK